jgi:hypothetical protein
VRIDRGNGCDGAENADGRPDGTDALKARAAERAGPEPRDEPASGDEASPAERTMSYRAKAEAGYRAYAIDQGCAEVEKIETDTVTPAMLRIEAQDNTRCLVGFENRLKGKDRLTEKVTKAVDEQPDLGYDNAFAVVKDAIRYTYEYPDERYAAGVSADIDRLMGEGFERVDLRNTWESEVYKGINSRWRVTENRQVFEVQFHTEASYQAKQETHAAYERLRHPATPKDEQEQLVEYQRAVNARVPTPPGATDIPDYP